MNELVIAHGSRHAFDGRIDGEGEENGDMWRLRVRPETDGRGYSQHSVRKFKPEIVWPRESE